MNHRGLDMLAAASNIPLHCNVCPKRPDFSDVSHLLTHVASKGHLSNYYKTKVKSSTDPVSKQLIDEHDDWYEEWNVQELMMERMNQKEKKRGGPTTNGNGKANRGSASRRGSAGQFETRRVTRQMIAAADLTRSPAKSVHSVHSVSTRDTPMMASLANRRARALRESTLDPQLGPRIKVEPKSRSATPSMPFALDPAALNRAYAPPMHSWPTTPYDCTPSTQDRSVFDSLYSTPSSDSGEIELPPRRAGIRRSARNNLSVSNPSVAPDDELEYDDGTGENSTLKGVHWDGMGKFDSATPDMRRRRNQKKAVSVVEQLKATSEIIEPEELVFDAEGELRRRRPITGNVEFDDEGMSPLRGESTPEPEFFAPKKRVGRRPRAALVEKEVNTGRVLRGRSVSRHRPLGNSKKRGPYFDGPEDDDDDLTYGRPRPKKRTGLSIHRDNTGPDITFDHPAPMSTLTAGFRNPFHRGLMQSHGLPPVENSFLDRGSQRNQSFACGTAFRPTNNNPLAAAPNFGSFGQLNGHSMFQNSGFQNHHTFQHVNGQQSMPSLQQQFGMGQHHFSNDIFQGTSQGQARTHHSNNAWDIFGLGQADLGLQSAADGHLGANDFTSLNPLFFSSAKGGPEDDEATISPPASEQERER